MKRSLKNCIATILLTPIVATTAVRTVKGIIFDRECGGHLKRAADANTIELAKQELGTVVSYLETNHLTTGYTSILFRTPDEDVGFWYINLRESLKELRNVDSETSSPLEKSNLLLKLRQTLLDHGPNGEQVTHPSGISIYPYNPIWALGWLVDSLLVAISILIFMEANAS